MATIPTGVMALRRQFLGEVVLEGCMSPCYMRFDGKINFIALMARPFVTADSDSLSDHQPRS
jgi:hypothetical protein